MEHPRISKEQRYDAGIVQRGRGHRLRVKNYPRGNKKPPLHPIYAILSANRSINSGPYSPGYDLPALDHDAVPYWSPWTF